MMEKRTAHSKAAMPESKQARTRANGDLPGKASVETLHEDLAKSQRDKKILDYLIAILGFGLCRAWIVFCLTLPLSSQNSPYAFNWMFLVAGALVAFFVAFMIGNLKENTDRTRRTLFIATAATLGASAIIIPLSLAQVSELLLFTGFIVGGIGAGMLQILWGERFATFEIRFATIASPAAAIVTALFVSITFPDASLVGYVLFPLLSFAFLVVMAQRTGLSMKKMLEPGNRFLLEADQELINQRKSDIIGDAAVSAADDGEDAEARKSFGIEVGKLMFSIMVFSFLCRILDVIPLDSEDPFAFFGGSPLFSLVVVGGAFLLIAAIMRDRFNPTLTYRLSLPIMVAGFVAIALFFDSHAALSILIINIGYEFFDILSWILFTEISRKKNENPLRIFGLGVAFMFTGMALGYLGGEVLNSLVLSGSLQINVIAMLSILSLVVVGFLVIPEGTIDHLAHAFRNEKKDVGEGNGAPEDGSASDAASERRFEKTCDAVAETYRLTPRESEVLVLLAHGRTLAIISRDLQIAKGTARTHIENIYRKLDVHKQQELIDLVEDYEPL